MPGCSVEHYLIQMLDFIHRNLDYSPNCPKAVLCGLIDFSKAFNRIDHNIIVSILSDLNVPTCALKLIISYLSNRKMVVRYNGAVSTEQHTPGGGPQGVLLTVLLFNLQVNYAGAPCKANHNSPLSTSGPSTEPELPCPRQPCQDKDATLKKKYVDDLSLLEVVDLKTKLVPAPTIIGPRNIHESSGLHLPADKSILQHQLNDLANFTEENKMKINEKKSKVIPFNFSQKYDFVPQLSFPNSDHLEVIYQTRLLGLIIESNLSWQAHADDICSRASKKLWVLIRFKNLGGTDSQLKSVYLSRIRSTLEFAAPVFTGALTKGQSSQIELVQKKALAIILGNRYTDYESALNQLKLERLDDRRVSLSLSFALKCVKSSKHSWMFQANPNLRPLSWNPKFFLQPMCHTVRYYSSPIPFLTRLLNKHYSNT